MRLVNTTFDTANASHPIENANAIQSPSKPQGWTNSCLALGLQEMVVSAAISHTLSPDDIRSWSSQGTQDANWTLSPAFRACALGSRHRPEPLGSRCGHAWAAWAVLPNSTDSVMQPLQLPLFASIAKEKASLQNSVRFLVSEV